MVKRVTITVTPMPGQSIGVIDDVTGAHCTGHPLSANLMCSGLTKKASRAKIPGGGVSSDRRPILIDRSITCKCVRDQRDRFFHLAK